MLLLRALLGLFDVFASAHNAGLLTAVGAVGDCKPLSGSTHSKQPRQPFIFHLINGVEPAEQLSTAHLKEGHRDGFLHSGRIRSLLVHRGSNLFAVKRSS